MLAYDYPLLGFFWSMMIFFLWIVWLMLLFRVFADIFRSKDLGGFAKVLWIVFVILAPFLGVFVYVIAWGKEMTQHAIDDAVARQEQMDAYVRSAAGSSGGTADEIAKLADLKAKGVLTEEEFAAKKASLLA